MYALNNELSCEYHYEKNGNIMGWMEHWRNGSDVWEVRWDTRTERCTWGGYTDVIGGMWGVGGVGGEY